MARAGESQIIKETTTAINSEMNTENHEFKTHFFNVIAFHTAEIIIDGYQSSKSEAKYNKQKQYAREPE